MSGSTVYPTTSSDFYPTPAIPASPAPGLSGHPGLVSTEIHHKVLRELAEVQVKLAVAHLQAMLSPPAQTAGPQDHLAKFPEVLQDGKYVVMPRVQENYPHVPCWTKNEVKELKNQQVTEPSAVKGQKGPTRQITYIKKLLHAFFHKKLAEGVAPPTWQFKADSEVIIDCYNFVYAHVPELQLAYNHTKIKTLAIDTYPSFTKENRMAIAAQSNKAPAPIAEKPEKRHNKPTTSKKTKKTKKHARTNCLLSPQGANENPDLPSTINHVLNQAEYRISPARDNVDCVPSPLGSPAPIPGPSKRHRSKSPSSEPEDVPWISQELQMQSFQKGKGKENTGPQLCLTL
ncbi:hypothetical protein C8Q80DRAFT_1273939 [Daedaleopsis nitida]|nr:hypothetical protein C8Q80DRAFT_1273939 [Daedaleopsis nitida]